MKNIFMLSILLALLCLGGCTAEEKELVDAVQKLSRLDYYEKHNTIGFHLDYSENGENTEEELRLFKGLLNNISYNTDSVFERGEDGGSYKTYISGDARIDMVLFNYDLWVESALSENKLDVIYKMPELIKMMIPEDYTGVFLKDYALLDYFGFLEYAEYGSGSDYFDALEASASVAPRRLPIDILGEYGITASLSGNVTVETSVNEDGHKGYEMKMNDEQFKNSIIAFLEQIKTNETLKDTIIGLIADEAALEGIEPLIDEAIAEIKSVLFDRTSILGEGGISYVLQFTPEDVPLMETITAHFSIDMNSLTEALPKDPDSYGLIDFTYSSQNYYDNVNADLKVSMPELTEENTLNIIDAMRNAETD